MSHQFRTFGFAMLLASTAMLPFVKAEGRNEANVVFSAPVAVPGQVLPPGKYAFKIAVSQPNRHIVQIFTEDQRELIATVPAIPAYRLKPTGNTIVTFQERSTGSPEAVSRLFYPGELAGVAFVYPDDQR
jgi:hypothetical protein